MLSRTRISRRRIVAVAAVLAASAASVVFLRASATAVSQDGTIRVRSAYSVEESVSRMKADIAAKRIKFFAEIDQSQLAADAGIKLNRSTLLEFGNPPLGTQFI